MQHHKMIHTLAIIAMSTIVAALACAQPVAQSDNALKVGHLAHLTTVQVMINGTGPHTFVLDTGASVTVVNQSLARSLELPILGETEVGSPMGTTPIVVDSLAIADVGLGDVHIKNLSAIAMDLDAMFGGLGAPAGILAATGLDGFLLTIDFPNEQVFVWPGELPAADGRRILNYDKDHIVPRLPVTVAGEVIMVDLDTGAPTSISLPAHYAETLPLKSAPTVTGRGRTVDAEFEILSAPLDGTIMLGEFEFVDQSVSFNDRTEIANMGIKILGDFSITIDARNHRSAFARTQNQSQAGGPTRRVVQGGNPKRSYGIGFRGISGDELNVIAVQPDSPAAAGGLNAGDVIIGLNGKILKTMSAEERTSALRGSPLTLLVRSGEVEQVVQLSLD